jgi:UDP-N-acetylmuramoyl-L-alanyl-D-glutamate--2,6-diaminopimelate ligase
VNKTHCIYRFAQELRKIEIPLIGRHNVENAITALACAYATGIPVFMIEKSLSRLAQIPGRLELVQSTTNSFYGHAFVDYAHTPDALEKALHSVRNICTGNVVVVFGCGGDRDKSKRPQMGHIAMQLADIVVITSDNPRSENPNAIIDDILQGIPTNSRDSVVSIIDRKEAIAYALCLLQENDVVLVAGKGHEDYQIIGTEKIHFDDREVIRNHQT